MVSNAIVIAGRLCTSFEGCRTHPYLCPAGIPTIGIGATYYANGNRVTLNDGPITTDQAIALLDYHLESIYMPAVCGLLPVAMTDGQLGALIDFAFNCGINNLKNSTLRRVILAGDWVSAPSQLRRWVKGGGKTLAGLARRREAEIALL